MVGKRKAAVPSPFSMRVMIRLSPGSMYSVSPARNRGEDSTPSSTTCTSPSETSRRLSPSGVTLAVKAVPISTNVEFGVCSVNPFDSGVSATNWTCPCSRNALLPESGSRMLGPSTVMRAPLSNSTSADPDDSSIRCPMWMGSPRRTRVVETIQRQSCNSTYLATYSGFAGEF